MRFKTILLTGLVLLVMVVVAGAQGFPSSSGRSAEAGAVPSLGNQPIAVGPFLFSPALQLSWENHSNLWQSATDPVADDIYVARLRLLFEVPIRESFVRISYTPQYRESKNRVLANNWDHFLEVSGDFEFSSGLTLGAVYRFVDGDVATDEVDPGGELVYSGRRFSKHYFGLTTDYWFSSTDGLSLDVTAMKVEWRGESAQGPGGESWYDYNQTTARAGWLHQLSPTMVMDVSLGYRDYEPQVVTETIREYTSTNLTAGFRGQLNDVLSTELRVGYEETDFSTAESVVPGFTDFSGLIVNGNITWALAHGSKLRLDLLRQPFASNYDFNSYYTATGGRLLYDLDLGRFYGQARARIQTNDYEIPDSLLGVKRSDDLVILGAGLGFRFTDKVSLRASYIHEDRESLDPYGYLNKVWLVDLIIGY